MGHLMFADYDPDEFDSEWSIVEIGRPDEKIVMVEWISDKQITALSTKRNIYRSSDQGATFEHIGQISHLEYWGKRIKDRWQDLRILIHWLVVKIKLYQLRKYT